MIFESGRYMKKILLISLSCILLLSCGNYQKNQMNKSYKDQVEKEIKENFSKISDVSDLTSSNPYDYTKNEYYEKIVNLGKDAVLILEEMYNNGELDGLYSYLSALAIQDITDCNLSNKYNLEWETAEDFYKLWESNNCDFKQ